VLLNDDVIDDSKSIDCNHGDECDDVGDANQNAEGTSISDEHDIASCQQVAEEQRNDETLVGCFKLDKAGKGGFEIHDNVLYHRKTVAGQSFL